MSASDLPSKDAPPADVAWLGATLRAQRAELLAFLEIQHQAVLNELGHAPAPFALEASAIRLEEKPPVAARSSKMQPQDGDVSQQPDLAHTWQDVDERDIGVLADDSNRQPHHRLGKVVTSPVFEMIMALVVVANAAVSIAEQDVEGRDIGYRLALPEFPKPMEQVMPAARTVFEVLGLLFGLSFALESTAKVIAFRVSFFTSGWNLFDLALVGTWILEQAGAPFIIDPMLLRLLRLGKLMRLLRIFKTLSKFEVFDSMHLLTSSIKGCWRVLLWSSILLGSIMTLMALAMMGQLMHDMEDPKLPVEARRKLFTYFGTFSRSFLTCFEITLANWVPVCRTLVENVSDTWGTVFILYRSLVGFAVVKVVTAVFMHETFKCASADDELMIRQKGRAAEKLSNKLVRFFSALDKSGDGNMSFDEFQIAIRDPRLTTWLAAMQVEIYEPRNTWHLLTGDADEVSIREIAQHIARLRGDAKHLDLELVAWRLAKLSEDMERVHRAPHPAPVQSQWSPPLLCPSSPEANRAIPDERHPS